MATALAIVVAAVHQATETMSQMATAGHGQIRAADQAGRLLVPTRSLPDRFRHPPPLRASTTRPRPRPARRLPQRTNRKAQATAAVVMIAAKIGAPSHILTRAHAAARPDSEIRTSGQQKPAEPEAHNSQACPGPVERILHDLGVTNPAMLLRASAIDLLGEHLILGAAHVSEQDRKASLLSASADPPAPPS